LYDVVRIKTNSLFSTFASGKVLSAVKRKKDTTLATESQ
jgi:hypothetical protein